MDNPIHLSQLFVILWHEQIKTKVSIGFACNFDDFGDLPISTSSDRQVTSIPKTKCFIDVGDAHISSTILEQQGRLAVKVNAISRCNVLQENVVLTVKIYKVGIGPPHLMAEKSTQGLSSKSRGFIVKNQFTYIFCKNRTKSKYYGLAYSKALINGKQYQTPPVWSENTIELKCGT